MIERLSIANAASLPASLKSFQRMKAVSPGARLTGTTTSVVVLWLAGSLPLRAALLETKSGPTMFIGGKTLGLRLGSMKLLVVIVEPFTLPYSKVRVLMAWVELRQNSAVNENLRPVRASALSFLISAPMLIALEPEASKPSARSVALVAP